jgi:FlaA1/EpsC-like NDP-sugar epimerase
MPFPLFRLVHVSIDTLLCLGVFICVYLLRFEGQIPASEMHSFWICLPLLPALRLFSNYALGLYSHLWKYVGLRELFSIGKAVLLGSVLFGVTTYLLGLTGFPRSIFVFEAAFYLLAIGGIRFSRRFSAEVSLFRQNASTLRTVIIGAGDAGAMVAAGMLRTPEHGYIPVGFIDDNPEKWRALIHGLRVFGGRDKIAEVISNREIDSVIVAMPSVSRQTIREYVEICQPLPVNLRIVPATHQILKGEVSIEQLRKIQIEDLLGRDPVKINDDSLQNFLKGKRVLVTGAGGSIGSELCRQILDYAPEVLYLLGHGENSVYLLQNEIKDHAVTPLIADIRNQGQLNAIFAQFKPEIIFHAAAHKHVPLMEVNLQEAFLNNVLGTQALLSAAATQGVQTFVQISTDKAAEPSSIMGLSKYFAELVVHRMGKEQPQMHCSIVRFGNVIGSRGSVIPLFQKQIEMGGPLTLTDPAMTRYFMTIPEAVQLVLQASLLKAPSQAFILDMGEPVKIMDLAQNLIRLSGYQANELEIKSVGIRKGEKLHETLVWSDETLQSTDCPQILAAQADPKRLEQHLCYLEQILSQFQQPDTYLTFETWFRAHITPHFPSLEERQSSQIEGSL